MRTNMLLSTKERVEIVKEAVFAPETVTVTGIAKKTGISKSVVSGILGLMLKEKIMGRKGLAFVPLGSPQAVAMRLLFNVSAFEPGLFAHPFVKAAGLYGSWAKGTNTMESDVDIWVRVEGAKTDEMASMQRRIVDEFPKAKVLFLDDEKIKSIREKNPLFYNSLVFGSIIMYGGADGLYK
ncbi:MAG: nucleotidyltransferase domain-containing protein [Candidatus Micrarchaeota archaeon]|nr:nucleotidyltransferase domain-containing protein [Candidatus Micrarchaeota archaeon]